ncbi:hypothetical protein PV11_05473 [Exophiala sideris]|uniref:DUF7029 domain-containing protein n=1 Tax=Exophiala sideris TaxID=1016849 RepID=A0A0D1W3Y0_9EURO|nr:hypothetical protein PV11_05473 [Exophiala sideris]
MKSVSSLSITLLLGLATGSVGLPATTEDGDSHGWYDWNPSTAVTSTSTSFSLSVPSSLPGFAGAPASGFGNTNSNGFAPSVSIKTVEVTKTEAVCAATEESVVGVGTSTGGSDSSHSGSGSDSSSGSGSGSGSGFVSSSGGSWSESGSTYYAQAPGANSSLSSPTYQPYVAGPTLLPAVHWDYPVDDIRNLGPINSSDLYYTSNGIADPGVQHVFASLSTTLQYDAVVLDHSSYVTSVSCSSTGILVAFESIEAFRYACDSWSAVEEFVLVTYTDGCGASDDQRTFWLSNSVEILNNTQSIMVAVETELAIEDAIYGVDMVWGNYYPTGSNSSTSISGSGSGSSSNSTAPSGSGSNSTGLSGSGTNSTVGVNGTTSSNSTSNANGGSSCGAAPSSTIDGFPAVACGVSDFDTQLDDVLGYLDFSSTDYDASLEDFSPDVSFDAEDLDDDDATMERRALLGRSHLRKRGIFSALLSVGEQLSSAVVAVATTGVALARAAVQVIPGVSNFIASATEFDPAVHGTATLALAPDDSATSPWGAAAQLYTSSSASATTAADITLYCVNCGLKGHVTLSGSAKFNVIDGLHGLSTSINADLEAGLNLGLVAQATFKDTKTKSLIKQAIPDLGVSVKGVFAAGVYIAVDAVATLDIEAQGQALIGITMTISDFQATLNLLDENSAASSSISGYTPTFKKTFEASGQISASATLALPVSLNVGIEITPLSYKKTLSLIEQPSLYGNVSFAGSAGGADAASDTCNNGFQYFASAQNDVSFDFFGIKTFTLNHYDSPPIQQGCKLLDDSSSTSSSTPAASSGTSSAVTETPSSTGDAAADSNTATSSGTDSTSTGAPSPTDDAAATSTTAGSGTDVPTNTGPTSTTDTDPAPTPSNPTTGDSTSSKSKRQITDSGTVIDDDDEDTFASDDGDETDSTDDPVDAQDSSTDPDNAEYTQDSSAALNATDNAGSDGGLTFVTINEIHNAFQLVSDENGNLYAGAPSTGDDDGASLFAVADTVVVGNDGDMILHYYPDVMDAYNTSRIRMSYEDHIPKGSELVTLMALDYDSDDSSNQNILFAVDTKGNAFSLVLCDFSNGADSKLFIVRDTTGVENLTLEKLRYICTGAPVSQCDAVALVLGATSTNS